MCSPIRRFEKRMLKRAGYSRKRYVLVRDPLSGVFSRQNVLRGGMIHDAEDNPVGYRWPRMRAARG